MDEMEKYIMAVIRDGPAEGMEVRDVYESVNSIYNTKYPLNRVRYKMNSLTSFKYLDKSKTRAIGRGNPNRFMYTIKEDTA